MRGREKYQVAVIGPHTYQFDRSLTMLHQTVELSPESITIIMNGLVHDAEAGCLEVANVVVI